MSQHKDFKAPSFMSHYWIVDTKQNLYDALKSIADFHKRDYQTLIVGIRQVNDDLYNPYIREKGKEYKPLFTLFNGEVKSTPTPLFATMGTNPSCASLTDRLEKSVARFYEVCAVRVTEECASICKKYLS